MHVFLVKNKGGKNMDAKRRNFTRQTVFALISTIFVPRHWHFTQRLTIHRRIFRLLFTNLQKYLEILLFLRQRETFFYSELLFESLRRKKSNISKHFWRLVNKRRKFLLCIVNLCVKFQCWKTYIVEMRAKTVWCVKIICFRSLLSHHFLFFLLFSSLCINFSPFHPSLFFSSSFVPPS